MNVIDVAALGLRQATERLYVIGNNVTNIATPGYKRQIAIQTAFATALTAQASITGSMTVHMDLGAGKLRNTGAPLDLALGEREFLLVQRPDGSTGLQAGGSLGLDASGHLVNASGFPVMGPTGPLSVPVISAEVRLDGKGQLTADGKAYGAVQVVKLREQAQVAATGDGLYAVSAPEDMTPVAMVRVVPGHLQSSNVVASHELVHLTATVRHAESMARLIQAADEMLGKAIYKLGEAG